MAAPSARPAPNPGFFVDLIDRLAGQIVQAIHQIFGFQYSRNSEHYIYQRTIATVASDALGTVYNDSIRITQEADFVCSRLNCNVRNSVGGILISQAGATMAGVAATGDRADFPYTLLITDGSTDRQLSNEPVDGLLCFGIMGGLPGLWARPRLFARNTVLSLRLTSLRANGNFISHIRVAFIGFKIYDARSLDLTARQP